MNNIMIWPAIATFCTGWFVVQFILSIIFGVGSEVDIDGDSSADLDLSDLISFKGLIHFGIGYSWWMVTHSTNVTWVTHAIAFGLGILVMLILWATYWGLSKLKKEIIPETGETLIGKTGEVYTKNPYTGEYTLIVEVNGAKREVFGVRSKSNEILPGQSTVIREYIDGKYYID